MLHLHLLSLLHSWSCGASQALPQPESKIFTPNHRTRGERGTTSPSSFSSVCLSSCFCTLFLTPFTQVETGRRMPDVLIFCTTDMSRYNMIALSPTGEKKSTEFAHGMTNLKIALWLLLNKECHVTLTRPKTSWKF